LKKKKKKKLKIVEIEGMKMIGALIVELNLVLDLLVAPRLISTLFLRRASGPANATFAVGRLGRRAPSTKKVEWTKKRRR
jgi:hypothetical protein